MNALRLQASHSLQPALSPRLQRAVRLLQMSSLDFSQVVRDALDTNPFLEPDESALGTDPEPGLDEMGPDAPPEMAWGAEPITRTRLEGVEEGAFDTLQAQTTLAEHLIGQLNVMRLSRREAVVAAAIAESLDDDGYLRCTLEEIAPAIELQTAAQPQELSIGLRLVQSLDPAGVGARSVAECLQLQLRRLPASAGQELAAAIVADHLQALAGRDMNALARRLGASRSDVDAACATIRRLDPRPGWRFGCASTQYLTPDVIVRKYRGQWTASLNPVVVPRVRLNRSYAELFNRHRNAQHGELVAHLQEAKWTVRNVEQRFSTILSVSRAILRRQHRFLAFGPLAMKPLALREIADEVGVHESTVSRVTNNKFMATPCGVFELKYFFSRGLATANGGTCSPTALRTLIQEMIAAESALHPLSDVEIARQLAQQGFKVARRTVTKYRQLMKLEPAERRRVVAVPVDGATAASHPS